MRLSGTRRSVGRARRIGAAMAGVFLCVMGVTMRAHDTGGRAVADTKSVGPPLAAALPRAPQPVGSKQPTDRVHPVASVFRAFATPPRSYSPVPIWWWSGERLDVRRLEWQMDRMVEGHVYNTVILNLAPSGPLYGSAPDSPPFFSEGWWRILRRVLTKAKALGLRVWLYDQLGFSTARIQERLMERTPAWRAAELAVLQQDVTGPTTVRMAAPGRGLSASAVPIGGDGQPTGAAVSLATSLRDGRLNKQMPSGRYRVMLFYEAQGGFDYMSPVAAGKLLNYVHGEFERKLKPYFGNTIPGTFQDELPPMNRWTRGFLTEFRRRKGYDLAPNLPMLWLDLGPRTTKVRCDVADVQAALLETAFFRPLYAWHQKHGMVCGYDQMIRDADPIEANRYYVDYMRTMRWFQAPGNDQNGLAKPHSSLAHLYGRPRVWLEGFYNSGWGQTLEELASLIHDFYADGANLYNPHAWYYSTLGGWWEWAPPCTSFRQPYWAHYSLFSDYVTRLSYVLSQGRHVCDVALLYPSSTVHSATTHDGKTGPAALGARDAYRSLCSELQRAGVDYDILDEASLQHARVDRGFLRVGPEQYRCVILPRVTTIHRSSMQKLDLLVRTGGIAATLGDPPADSPDAGARDEAVVNASGRLFADGAEPSRRIGAGSALHAPSDVADLVGRIAARVPPHAVGVSRYLHRRIGDADTYLLVSRSTHDVTREVTLKHSGSAVAPASRAKPADVAPASRRQPVNVAPASRRQPSAWIADPWTGTVRRAQTRPAGPGRITVRVSFAASRAQFVVLSATPPVLTPSRSPLLSRPSSPDRAPVFAATGALRPPAERVGRPTEPQPIALEGEWRTALMPTLDNRFGDFAHPASAAPVAVECRRFRYREEADNEDGITNEWYVPDHADANWQPVTAGHGPHWWISRPDVGNRPLRMPGPDDGDWRPDPKVWEPAVFSLRTGIEKDPVYAQWLGPKGRVPDEYLDFGTAPPGTVRFAVTFVHVPTACEAAIRCGAGDARVAVNGRWLPAGSVVRARLPQGYNAIAAQFRHTGNAPLRTYVHIGPAESASRGPAWIWTGRTSDVSDCYARKVLHLDAKPDWASLSVTADNGYELYVNGRFIGRDVGAGTERWSVAERYSVAQHLRTGRNVIAIHGVNLGGPAGIVAVLSYGRRAQGPVSSVVTDASWRVAPSATAAWTKPDFNDATWSQATIIGHYPCEPWGAVEQLTQSRPGVLPGSAWLNGSVLPWVPGLVMDPLPGMHKRVGWYRFATPPGASRMWLPIVGRYRVFLDGRECTPTDDGAVDVPLDLQEHSQTCAVRIEQPAGRYGGAAFDGPVRFAVGIGATQLGDWTKRGLPHYSGGVRYVQEVQIPAHRLGGPLALDLGRVRGTAQVSVNGRPAGVRLWRPYRFDVSDLLQAGSNRIEVIVYNTLGPHFGAGYPTPYVLPGQEVSGLLGPVRITGPVLPPPPPPSLSGLTNVALASSGAVATASSEHPSGLYLADSVLAGHTTGERWARGGGWNDATEAEFPDWIEVKLPEPANIRAVRVLTLEPAERHGIKDFDVEVRRGGDWVVCAEVRDNEDVSVVVPIADIRSDRIRIAIHASNDDAYSRVVAVGVYAPRGSAEPETPQADADQ